MKNKPLNYRQSLFVKYYTGDNGTKGNATASALKAGYTWKYANQACKVILGLSRIKTAIDKQGAKIEAKDENSREFVTKEMLYQYTKNKDKKPLEAIRALENLGKNVGWYAEDNAQQQEKAILSEQEKEEAIQYAKWRLMQGLSNTELNDDDKTVREITEGRLIKGA